MAEATVSAEGITRREFLYYIWGASIAILTLEVTGLMVWFMLPRFREGEFGGTFTLPVDNLPDVNNPPFNFPDGRFWLVNVNSEDPNELMCVAEGDSGPIVGAAALYKVCTHLGCIYAWVDVNDRFECPCHGSKYRLDGRRITGPAPRSLDRFKMIALDANEQPLAESQVEDNTFGVLALPSDTAFIRVDTGDRQDGQSQVELSRISEGCP
jgi:cytochrome b6-f complex iron-sulfur subunit